MNDCTPSVRRMAVALSVFATVLLFSCARAAAAEPVKVGFSMAMTGGVA